MKSTVLTTNYAGLDLDIVGLIGSGSTYDFAYVIFNCLDVKSQSYHCECQNK